MSTSVALADLVEAFDWASAAGPFENGAYVCRATGRIWLTTDFDDTGEKPPEDIEDELLYLPVPGRAELDLGKSLALRYVEEHMPESLERVRSFFAKAGAYSRFKQLLGDAGQLDSWYAYELQSTHEALRAWAAENGIEVAEPPGAAG
ncbi:hypothetical protein [Polaromonas sp.]|uniref:hypothetical protein n=1 Tax=Polaromonas sp. TaxID=1869339 RepID=UPI003266B562